jgi:Flp pilus assembly protein TadG
MRNRLGVRFVDLLARFRLHREGNVVITFALALVPIVGAVGAAVDYSQANSARSAMQAALDSTALMLSKEASLLNMTQLNQKGTEYFKALFNRPRVTGITVTASYLPTDGKLDMTAVGMQKTDFMGLMGQSSLELRVNSTVRWGMKKLELALVLDNSGSMGSSGKMAALKTASKDLLKILEKAAPKPGDVKVAIIPYDANVNIGAPGNKNKYWIRYTGTKWTAKNWDGCVADRDQPNDVLDTPPSLLDPATHYPAGECDDPLAEALPLTWNWTQLNKKIDDLTLGSGTNLTIGLVWGWHALTPAEPYPEGSATKNNVNKLVDDVEKVIILLTDGNNSKNRWTSSTSEIDKRTKAVCTNVKAAGIKLITIRVIEGNAALLKECASDPSLYYEVKQASQLVGVFQQIGSGLSKLRVAK